MLWEITTHVTDENKSPLVVKLVNGLATPSCHFLNTLCVLTTIISSQSPEKQICKLPLNFYHLGSPLLFFYSYFKTYEYAINFLRFLHEQNSLFSLNLFFVFICTNIWCICIFLVCMHTFACL